MTTKIKIADKEFKNKTQLSNYISNYLNPRDAPYSVPEIKNGGYELLQRVIGVFT